MTPTTKLLQALAVTSELTRTQLSESAARVMAQDLSGYPESQVLGALIRCRRELRPNGLTLESILTRLDDGRPGPEDAWASVAPALADESVSVVWTEEMAQASRAARVIIADDHVAARMAFLESYRRLVQQARDARIPVQWTPSLGYDAGGREGVLIEAVRLGRLTAQHASALLPYKGPIPQELAKLIGEVKRIEEKAP